MGGNSWVRIGGARGGQYSAQALSFLGGPGVLVCLASAGHRPRGGENDT